MKNIVLNKVAILFAAFACAALVTACDDEPTRGSDGPAIGPDGEVIPDSILASDSLYTWYMESRYGSSSSQGEKTGSSSGDADDEDSDLKQHLLPPAGFYSELTIPVPLPLHGGTIRCTFNGSEPTPETPEFAEPYSVRRNTPVRCAEFVGDSVVRKSSHTFFINENARMPVVAITVDSVFFLTKYADTRDCYGQNPHDCAVDIMSDAEFPVHVEFFEKGSQSARKTWQIDAGISLMGNYSRTYAKKPVTIKMKKEYEDGRLNYPLFSTRPEACKFKGFNLRNGGNRYVGDFVADPAMTSIVEGSSVDYQRSRQVLVYYNGVYMGIHDLRERLNEHFVETNYGIDSKDVDMVKHKRKDVIANGGTADSYLSMLDFVANNDFSGADNAAYKEVQSMIDVGSYADYMAAEIYLRNADWPSNNVRAWRSSGQPYKFILFDVDQGFGWEWVSEDFMMNMGTMFDWIRNDRKSGRTGPGFFAHIYIKLRENPDFCRMFVNHGAVMLSSYLTYERVVAAVNKVNSEIPQEELERDLDNEAVFERYYSPYGPFPEGFDRTGEAVVSYAYGRTESTRNEYRIEFGLGDDISVTIAASGNGSVLLDGMKLPSKDYTGTFFKGNDMLLEAVPAEGRVFDGWKDGSKENPRMVSPNDGDEFIAKFK